jgi:TolB-like protein/DNA-binding winged helix-turn-helix (wHTH) protein
LETNQANSGVYRFGTYEFEPQSGELRKQGIKIKLEGQPVAVLAMLLERSGELVPRTELQRRLWPADTFVDFEQSLNAAIKRLRGALNDSSAAPRYVETLSRRGYRFIAPVDCIPAGKRARLPEAPRLDAEQAAISKRRRWHLWLALAATLAIAAILARSVLFQPPHPGTTKIMLAVLPFENLSGDSQDYFAEGLTEEMITQLGSLDPQHLGVIARTSAMQYKGTHKDTSQIARELAVNYLLEGSVRQTNGRVRVTAQLIQASDQTHLWANSFDRDQSDVLRLQTDVARAIAGQIQLTLSQQVEARLAGTSTINPEAHKAYLRGLQAWNLRTKEGFEQSITEFSRAIDVDPNYAPAYAGLARSYSLAPIFGVSTAAETMPKARDAAKRALAIDDALAEAHTTLAFVKAHYEYDWPASEREYLRAIEINPSDAYGRFFYSNSYLSPLGRHDMAIAEMKKAAELDPLSISIQSFVGITYIWARRYDEALAQFQAANQLNPNFAVNHERLARCYIYLGKYDEAIREQTKARLLTGEDAKMVVMKEETLRKALSAGGPPLYWWRLLELSQMKENPPEAFATPYGIAQIYAQLGETEKALESLEKAYADREIPLTEIGIEPALDPLRSEPRFQDLLHRIGVPR